MERPKIYGAGLLSSIGESYHCLESGVKKIPFSLACVEMDYDITRPQPQLFVSKSFDELTEALDKLADRMAFRIGGVEALARAKQAQTLVTAQLNTGVQVSGILSDYRVQAENNPIYLMFKGPTQLAYGDSEIAGQGADYHREGFGSPIGLLADGRSPSELTEADLQTGRLSFSSGVEVSGKFKSLTRKNDKTVIVSFTDCTVRRGIEMLFKPEWGVFDMVCGEVVNSVFGGAADRGAYLAVTGGFHQPPGRQKTNLTYENRSLDELYAQLRNVREKPTARFEELELIHHELESDHPKDWLLRWELLDLAKERGWKLICEPKIRASLAEISKLSPDRAEMIRRGLELLQA
jgi:phenylalanine-4-hydroxylase